MIYFIIDNIGDTEKINLKTYLAVFSENQRLQSPIWEVFMAKKHRKKSKN